MNLHVRDIDARMREYVPIGSGVMDFKAIADAVKGLNSKASFPSIKTGLRRT